VYYIYDIPAGVVRGGHSHKECKEFLVALSGSFEVVLKDGNDEKRVLLNRPDKGLLITSGIWRELENFSSGSVCLVLSSEKYSEDDYVRDYDTYLQLID
ncbi:MAG: FdtA/QdtA family cupin domain-containing protein, partial [Muribaculaceae bacterium]|nr:FdtA/QdtA family cupin domain-containing protein [Muribaculaceae bacterium]